jgi:hypothetical protein
MQEILRAIALFRLIVPDVPLRLAAGRESALADFLSSAFMAGADGMMIGGYLTQRDRPGPVRPCRTDRAEPTLSGQGRPRCREARRGCAFPSPGISAARSWRGQRRLSGLHCAQSDTPPTSGSRGRKRCSAAFSSLAIFGHHSSQCLFTMRVIRREFILATSCLAFIFFQCHWQRISPGCSWISA